MMMLGDGGSIYTLGPQGNVPFPKVGPPSPLLHFPLHAHAHAAILFLCVCLFVFVATALVICGAVYCADLTWYPCMCRALYIDMYDEQGPSGKVYPAVPLSPLKVLPQSTMLGNYIHDTGPTGPDAPGAGSHFPGGLYNDEVPTYLL